MVVISGRFLRQQPGFRLTDVAEYAGRTKISSCHHLKHPHHPEHGIGLCDNRAQIELNLFPDSFQFSIDGAKLAACRQRLGFAEVQQDVKGSGTGRISAQSLEVFDYFRKR